MIDKNDVKMPVPKKDADLKGKEKVMQIEELLRLVNDADNKQELRLKQDYYSRFHWFGGDVGDDAKKSYFSYQEEAVYDFVFNLNKSGILSDQVGMGKTIEAGMIISELASRNELRSLLIVVPNEILAQKWEYELAHKFGINGNPKVKAIKNMDDFSRCVFDCVCNEKFYEYLEYEFNHSYNPDTDEKLGIEELVSRFVKQDIAKAVELINIGFDNWDMPGKPHVMFDGSSFSITGTKLRRPYKYDESGHMTEFLQNYNRTSAVTNQRFIKRYRDNLNCELEPMFVVIGDYFKNIPSELSAVAQSMINNNPILVIPMSYSEYKGENVIIHEFLNHELPNKMENYKHQYNVFVKNENDPSKSKIKPLYEPYRIIDFFIDVGYQTLIVDEVHDYIDVEARMKRTDFHDNNGLQQFPSSDYNRYELFDDYYFIKKSSLYKKLKNLADKASRKIFLTATPIKSDMIDFYLLTLLASNKDSEAYNKISDSLRIGAGAFSTSEEIDKMINGIYDSFTLLVDTDAPEEFRRNSAKFLQEEKRDSSAVSKDTHHVVRCVYPYFNNSFLRTHLNSTSAIKDYLNSHILYMSVEEIVMELILAYNAEYKTDYGVAETMKRLQALLDAEPSDIQTRIVFRALLNNTLKLRFEEDFTKENGEPIKRIRDLLMIKDGARKWHKTYRKYGIRHTRHQTYNLADYENLDKLNKSKMERYRNLPLWPRRDGKVIYLVRDDVFFDCFVNVRRELPKKTKQEIRIEDLPNVDKMLGDDNVKAERFANATKIFDYINNSMSGGDDVNHLPQFNKYDSVDIDDKSMVEYKLALVNYLMSGRDGLGRIKNKVLLFAENNRDEIIEWFRYQKLAPLYKEGFPLDPAKMKQYEEKWSRYGITPVGSSWQVSDNADGLEKAIGDYLVIIDPKRYEKGVDLQKADTIINFDINYDPLKMEQRIGRIDRIRPKLKIAGDKKVQKPKINIISFVPLNNMSGFVINFFAYELKMFTQWMGETTGIVSVPDDADDTDGNKSVKGQQISFENKVYEIEKYYNHLYRLCGSSLNDNEVANMTDDFEKFFTLIKENPEEHSEFDKFRIKYDFEFLQTLRAPFDLMFRNSISPQRSGYTVDRSNNKVMRFNSANGPFRECLSETCDKCPSKSICNGSGNKKRNIVSEFTGAVKEFLDKGERFYEKAVKSYADLLSKGVISDGKDTKQTQTWLRKRSDIFKQIKSKVMKSLSAVSDSASSFTIPYAKYEEIFNPLKELYWDDVAAKYIEKILSRFYKQCDSVLASADLFENFIKVLSIADFMKNMEGNV